MSSGNSDQENIHMGLKIQPEHAEPSKIQIVFQRYLMLNDKQNH